jgi:ribulose-5-phosphate 4-epimerase/fuculose-1-phosphate aldolase
MSDDASRLEVAQASRILFNTGVVDAFGHVSRRSEERADAFFFSRSLAPGLVRIEDVLLHDLDDNPVSKVETPVFLERFIHAEIYRARSDVNAVVHSDVHIHGSLFLTFCAIP